MGTVLGFLAGLTAGAIGATVIYKLKAKGTMSEDVSKPGKDQIEKSDGADNDETKSAIDLNVNHNAAQKTFLNNVNLFKPKLNTLLDGTYNANDWTEGVVSINNKNLTAFWQQIYKDSNSVLRVLSMWGIKPESCTSFVSNEAYKNMYTKSDGSTIAMNEKYNVVKQCWILTQTNDDGKIVKSVLLKGEVE